MKRSFNFLALLTILSLSLPFPIHAQAQIKDLEHVFSNFIGVAITLVGLVCVAMLVVGGLKYLTSGADKEGASGAQKTITYGVIGLIVTVSAWIILSLLGTFLGVDFTTFRVTLP